MNKIYILLIFVLFATIAKAQIVNIPDANFKNALVNDPVNDLYCDGWIMVDVDTNDDGEIQVSEAEAVECLRVPYKNISSLEGIQSFINLTVLTCHNNNLLDIDISQNSALLGIDCQYNSLESLDVSNNQGIYRILCYQNNLTELDVTQNPEIRTLDCHANSLTELDITQNPLLRVFICNDNDLTDLDLSQNQELLLWLNCSENNLTSLNVRNGNNQILDFIDARNNAENLCIQVDDIVQANNESTWYKDDTAYYNEDCSLAINDFKNKPKIIVFPNPVKTTLNLWSESPLKSLHIYNIQGQSELDIDGNIFQLDFSNYAKGIYFISIETEKGYSYKRIIKE